MVFLSHAVTPSHREKIASSIDIERGLSVNTSDVRFKTAVAKLAEEGSSGIAFRPLIAQTRGVPVLNPTKRKV